LLRGATSAARPKGSCISQDSSTRRFRRYRKTGSNMSTNTVEAFLRSFLAFSHGKVVSDDPHAPGVEIGRSKDIYRRIRIESNFGKLTVLVTEGHLPYPYGRETTGYEVANLTDTLATPLSPRSAKCPWTSITWVWTAVRRLSNEARLRRCDRAWVRGFRAPLQWKVRTGF
jgi:hypothetical protein